MLHLLAVIYKSPDHHLDGMIDDLPISSTIRILTISDQSPIVDRDVCEPELRRRGELGRVRGRHADYWNGMNRQNAKAITVNININVIVAGHNNDTKYP